MSDFKYKYQGTERIFNDPMSPYNDIPTVELEKMVRQAELRNKAAMALNQLSPEVRKALQEQLAPTETQTLIDPEFDNPESAKSVHRYSDGTPIYGGRDE